MWITYHRAFSGMKSVLSKWILVDQAEQADERPVQKPDDDGCNSHTCDNNNRIVDDLLFARPYDLLELASKIFKVTFDLGKNTRLFLFRFRLGFLLLRLDGAIFSH